MTSPECPVCATPYEAGAATCAFCGVSLLEPPTETQSKPEVDSTPQPAAEPEARAEATPSPEPAAIAEPAAEEPAAPASETIDESDGIGTAPADDPTPGTTEVVATAEAADAGPETAEAAQTTETPEIPDPPAARPPGARAPSFARKPTTASAAQRRTRRIEWSVVAGLAVLLLVQSVASDFGQLAGNATTRPWLQHACAFLRCTLPPWREPQALRLLQRDVRANPDHPGLLRISASFLNDARWAQPWPRLRVTLSDAEGRAIAARDFSANEYLGTAPTANGIAGGQVAGVAVDVVDPSPRVTAFTFEFR